MRSLEGLVVLTLKLVRVASGISLTTLRKLSGVNETDISRIERGKLIPSESQLARLAATLNIPTEDLLKVVDVREVVTHATQQAVAR